MPQQVPSEITRYMDGNSIKTADEEDSYILSFSSEEPDVKYGVSEILEHSFDAVKTQRLENMGVLLFNHDINRVLGKVIDVKIEDKRGIARVKFDNDDFSRMIKEKVDSGTLKGVSVKARVNQWEIVKQAEQSKDGKFKGPCVIAKNWEPIEISIVSTPADPTVGVGRSLEQEMITNMPEEIKSTISNQENITSTMSNTPILHTSLTKSNDIPITTPTLSAESEVSRETVIAEERQRVNDITTLCREFDLTPDDYISKGYALEEARAAVLQELARTRTPVATVVRDEQDTFRSDAVSSLLLRAGLPVEKPTEGAQRMRNLKIRDLMNTCARREGITSPELLQPEELLRQFFTPTSAFPLILDQTVKEAYTSGYQTYPATFDLWTTRGSLSDFKPSKRGYMLGSAGELLLVPEGSEIKHDKLASYERPDRKLQTFGRQFTLTREAIYNDDIGIVTGLPARYAASARKTLNRHVYDILGLNKVIYDGNTLFDSANHGNLATGAAPSIDTIRDMIKMMALMRNEEGELIYANPRYILCPVGMGDVFRELFDQRTLILSGPGGTISTKSNPLAGRGFEIIEDPVLNTINTNGEFEYYLVADKTYIPTLQVDYLNGNETPTIRRMEHAGQLGFVWDVILDWATTILDYRGIIKNPGK